MSAYNIYISPPPYLRDWLMDEFWNSDAKRIEFPQGSAERIILELYLAKVPKDYHHRPDQALLPVEVPTFRGKNPSVYNHLPQAATELLMSTIKKRFKMMMWQELHTIRTRDIEITDLIYAFMESHGIDQNETNFIAIRQMYWRMRKIYDKKQK